MKISILVKKCQGVSLRPRFHQIADKLLSSESAERAPPTYRYSSVSFSAPVVTKLDRESIGITRNDECTLGIARQRTDQSKGALAARCGLVSAVGWFAPVASPPPCPGSDKIWPRLAPFGAASTEDPSLSDGRGDQSQAARSRAPGSRAPRDPWIGTGRAGKPWLLSPVLTPLRVYVDPSRLLESSRSWPASDSAAKRPASR